MGKRGAGEGSIKKRKDGRYEASVRVGVINGKLTRKSVYGKTRADVQSKLDTLRREANQGMLVAPDSQTLGHFLDSWLENSVKVRLKPKTHASYAQLVRLYIKPALGEQKLQRLSPEMVQAFLNGRLKAGSSPRTVAYVRAVLRSALHQALRWSRVTRNAAQLVDPPRQVKHQLNPLTPEQAKSFLKAIRGHRLEALFHVALRGLRQGEVLGLRWEDVDVENKALHVRVALQRLNGEFEFVEPKTTQSRRTIPLDAKLLSRLKRHRTSQAKERLLAGGDWEEWGLVFTTRRGRPLEGTRITRDFKKLLKDAKLPKQRFHDLRHACATFMLADGLSPHEVKEWLGHSQVSLTLNTYAHVLPEARRDAADRLARMLA